MAVRDMSEDRVVELSREFADRYVKPSLTEVGRELIKQAKRKGQKVVVLSDNIDLVIRSAVESLAADELVCNSLEIIDGKATGRLCDPIVGASIAGQWAQSFAAERELDLTTSAAYGASAADSLLLSAMGQPCVVDPDWKLRRIAHDHNWPIVES